MIKVKKLIEAIDFNNKRYVLKLDVEPVVVFTTLGTITTTHGDMKLISSFERDLYSIINPKYYVGVIMYYYDTAKFTNEEILYWNEQLWARAEHHRHPSKNTYLTYVDGLSLLHKITLKNDNGQINNILKGLVV